MRWQPLLALIALTVAAQEPPAPPPARPVIGNLGKPMPVPFACSEEDIQLFGMTCTAQDPCPVYFQASHVEAAGAKLFLTGNLHNGATTMYSILLASEDEGKTWIEPHERIRSAGLDQVRFLDFETGWISGQTLLAFPRDPFLLTTTDGGKNWRLRPVFSETKIGSVEQFWFESRSQGQLLIDRTILGETGARYELYETTTGGETWMVREVSARALRLKLPPEEQSGWRVRADGATKAHRIERRQGERWQTVASFLVRASECKPEDKPLPEPVETEPPPPAKPGTAGPKPEPAPPKPPAKPPTLKKKSA